MADEIPPVITEHPANTEPPPAEGLTGAVDSAIDETFTNFSTVTFERDYWGYDYEQGFSGPSITPGPVLDTAGNNVQEFAQSQMLSWLDQGPIAVFCCWRNPATGVRFGVRLRAKFQMFGLGPRPVWDVMQDTNPPGSAPDWQKSGDGPSAPYTWPDSVGFSITATPNSGHTTLSVAIGINDLPARGAADGR